MSIDKSTRYWIVCVSKNHIQSGVEGKHLIHSELEADKRTRMKILKINSNEDFPIRLIESLLNEALDLYRNGVIKVK